MMYSPLTVIEVPRPWPVQQRQRVLQQHQLALEEEWRRRRADIEADCSRLLESEWQRRKALLDAQWQKRLDATAPSPATAARTSVNTSEISTLKARINDLVQEKEGLVRRQKNLAQENAVQQERLVQANGSLTMQLQDCAKRLAAEAAVASGLRTSLARAEADNASLKASVARAESDNAGLRASAVSRAETDSAGLDRKDGELVGLRAALGRKDGELAGLRAALERKDGELLGLRGALDRKDGELVRQLGLLRSSEDRRTMLEAELKRCAAAGNECQAGQVRQRTEKDNCVRDLLAAEKLRSAEFNRTKQLENRLISQDASLQELVKSRSQLLSERSSADLALTDAQRLLDACANREKMLKREKSETIERLDALAASERQLEARIVEQKRQFVLERAQRSEQNRREIGRLAEDASNLAQKVGQLEEAWQQSAEAFRGIATENPNPSQNKENFAKAYLDIDARITDLRAAADRLNPPNI